MAKITSDPDAAIEFLKKWEPAGPWCLTAIIPDGTTETRTFDPGYNNDDLAEWLDGCEGRRNVYFSVNRPQMGLTKKARKEEIIFMLALHVDVDPDKGKDIKKERTKILKRIKKFEPKPSIVIDSGGGYQAFWLLKDPVKIEGKPEPLEAYNKQLELLFTADHCHNIDRIMRLPGTINIPNKKKKDAGRVKVLSSLVSAYWDLRYSLDDFTAAPVVEASHSNVKVTISGNLPTVNLDDLDISDDTKMLIIQGDDPDKPERFDGDRSKAVWRVLHELVRAEVSNDMIAAILLNQDHSISAHILGKSQPKSYLIRQIEKAHRTAKKTGFPSIMEEAKKITPDSGITKHDGQEPGEKPYASSIVASLVAAKATPVQVEAVFNTVKEQAPEKFTKKLLRNQYDDEKNRTDGQNTATIKLTLNEQLELLNKKHFVVTEAGKTRVLTEVFDDEVGRWRLERSSFEDIRNRYRNKIIIVGIRDGNLITDRLGHWWLDHPKRRQYDRLVFKPGKNVSEDTFNLWRGFTVKAKRGEWGLFLRHIWKVVCGQNTVAFKYLIRWMARAVQEPDVPGEIAVVLRGLKGTGKGMFANIFGGLFGQHYFSISNPKLLTGNFNAHLRDCVVLFCDEAFWAGDKPGQAQLQTTITESHLSFEAKGIDAVMGPNHTHIIMASNKEWVIPASTDERRYFVLEIGEERRNDYGYFKAILEEMKKGGNAAMLHDLMHLNLSNFEVREVPQTAALARQKEESLTAEEQWWLNRLTGGRMLPWHEGWLKAEVPSDLLFDDYVKHAGITGERHKSHETTLGKAIKKLTAGRSKKRRNRHYEVPTGETYPATGKPIMKRRTGTVYLLPSLEECRKIFEEVTGTKPDWDDGDEITF